METIEDFKSRSARSSNASSVLKYKNIAEELEREDDPQETAARLEAASILTLDGVKQFSIQLDAPLRAEEGEDTNIDDLKVSRLCELHDELLVPQIVVYVRNQAESDKLQAALKRKTKHLSVTSIATDTLDRARDTARLRFQAGFDHLLIVNDDMPNHRGLEFISHEKQTIFIINYSLPKSVPLYSKRIGRRIANYSRKGVVLNLLSFSPSDHDMIDDIKKFYDTEITTVKDTKCLAWKELQYFLHFCP